MTLDSLYSLTFDNCERKPDVLDGPARFSQTRQKQINSYASGFVQVLADGCQAHVPGYIQVVETHHCQVLGYAQPKIVGSFHDPNRLEIGGSKNGSRAVGRA